MTDIQNLDARLKRIAKDAMAALQAEISGLSRDECLAVTVRFATELEDAGYPIAELHMIHQAAVCELYDREWTASPEGQAA